MSEKNTFPDSLLDLAFTNIPEAVHTVSTLPPVSDHLPILLHTYIPLIESTAPEIDNPGSPRLDIKRANYERVQTAIERSTEQWDRVFHGDNREIDDLWHEWKTTFYACVTEGVPVKQPPKSKRINPWFNKYLHKRIRTKNCCLKKPVVPRSVKTGRNIKSTGTKQRPKSGSQSSSISCSGQACLWIQNVLRQSGGR